MKFNIQKFYVLPTQYIHVYTSYESKNKQRLAYIPLTDRFLQRRRSVFCEVRTESWHSSC